MCKYYIFNQPSFPVFVLEHCLHCLRLRKIRNLAYLHMLLPFIYLLASVFDGLTDLPSLGRNLDWTLKFLPFFPPFLGDTKCRVKRSVFKVTRVCAFLMLKRETLFWQTLFCFCITKSLSQQFTFCVIVCLGLSE